MKENLKQESAAEETDDIERPEEEDDAQSPALDEQASDEDELSPNIKPIERKIGESRDNLRRRQEWFQRRTGK